MVIIENSPIADLPVLHLCQADKQNEKLPLVIFVHGFTSAKEHNLHYAYLLAERGFRVLLPEALYHGERGEGLSQGELNLRFWDIVINQIHELKVLKDDLVIKGLADQDRVGIAGTSMGGIVTLGAMTQYPWIKAAVSLMGSPYYEKFSRYQIDEMRRLGIVIPLSDEEVSQKITGLKEFDLSLQPEKLDGRPLLFWHGKRDEVVPYQYTRHFYEEIKPLYKGREEHLKFISDSHAGHKVSREGLLETVHWFSEHL